MIKQIENPIKQRADKEQKKVKCSHLKEHDCLPQYGCLPIIFNIQALKHDSNTIL